MGVQNESKRRAAEQAVGHVQSGMVLGLGTGSTAALAVEAIGRKLAAGELVDIVGIPTSTRTRDQANALGIPLTTLEQHPNVDLTIDGADEVDAQGNLIKGGGGALLWEKIVAAATALYVIVVDQSKVVERLGAGFAVPIEVMPFGWKTHLEAMRSLGGDPTLRRDAAGQPYLTDGGHYIIDVAFPGGMDDPRAVDRVLRDRPGVVETGLFLGMEPRVIVGRAPSG
jgi:ribose 5-phosphate isomerase A